MYLRVKQLADTFARDAIRWKVSNFVKKLFQSIKRRSPFSHPRYFNPPLSRIERGYRLFAIRLFTRVHSINFRYGVASETEITKRVKPCSESETGRITPTSTKLMHHACTLSEIAHGIICRSGCSSQIIALANLPITSITDSGN